MSENKAQIEAIINQLEMLDDSIEIQCNQWQMQIHEMIKSFRALL